MITPRNEHELLRLAIQLTTPLREGVATSAELERLRAQIRSGSDPLGADFMRLRSPDVRRDQGAVYTPFPIVEAMVEWARREPGDSPVRIVDPGAGSGRFLAAAASAFPEAQLIAVEIDPLATFLLRANAAVLGFADRLTVYLGNYCALELPSTSGRTLFLGNPPYVRHHNISEEAKGWFAESARRAGLRASKLAGLHVHFFMRTREIARTGDFGTFITSSEWLDVNYGSVLRHMLADGLGGSSLHILAPDSHPFGEVMTTGVISCFRVGNRPRTLAVRTVSSLDELKPLHRGEAQSWDTVKRANRWSTLGTPKRTRPADVVEVGDLFRAHRGQVTGMNSVWVAGPEADGLPARFLFPTITRARELFRAGPALYTTDRLRLVIDLPVDLYELTAHERFPVERFLRWARQRGAHESYVARNRRAWWSVGLREPPPILCTYMARRAPVFILNSAGARYLNIAHGLYPRERMADTALVEIVKYLNSSVTVQDGRIYAGGLVKFEPREIEKLLIPRFNSVTEAS